MTGHSPFRRRPRTVLSALALSFALVSMGAAPAIAAQEEPVRTVTTAAMPSAFVEAWKSLEPDEGSVAPMAASPVGSSWVDHGNRRVVLRIAAQNKIRFTHNTTRGAVRIATQYPDSSKPESGQAREYFATFLLRESGRVTGREVVRTVVDFRPVDGNPQGVITSYCMGKTACPSWVNEVIGGGA